MLEVYVPSSDVGKFVKEGTPLFRVDDRHLNAQLKYQEANLASAQAQLAKLGAMPRKEEVPALEAKVRATEANYRLAKDQADRGKVLSASQTLSVEENVHRQMTAEMMQQAWEQAKADLALLNAGAWQADKDISSAAVALAKAQIEQTKAEIERATVRAPIDGHVLQVNVRPGEYVGASGSDARHDGHLSKGTCVVWMSSIARFGGCGGARFFARR